VLLVPAYPALHGVMDREYGHVRRYRQKDLIQKTRAAGFLVEKVFTLNFFGIFGWWLNGRVLKRRALPAGQLKLFESVAPLLTGLEDLLCPPLGLSLVVVAIKEG
jgi:hypothetical protein